MLGKAPQVACRNEFAIAVEAFNHLLPFNEEAGVEGNVGRQERVLVLAVELTVAALGLAGGTLLLC